MFFTPSGNKAFYGTEMFLKLKQTNKARRPAVASCRGKDDDRRRNRIPRHHCDLVVCSSAPQPRDRYAGSFRLVPYFPARQKACSSQVFLCDWAAIGEIEVPCIY
ncbi:predicted protein [Histoplasma capsulatum G186AR]|uniref:Uncharacterized protein n=1 Tax=Ajellomyces capsulatus (strain G186AR / H82 / ATCC MYA-2454 / RMSCC 2432) TaxID=447093 RepID=C0NHZ9_AJECG|nr:uncharacterized protein HCBG_02971 [Histoplasma capsulatum G186AR]EEH09434.1 predicted protein [Histoplasma capsulatum G186AR]